MPTQYYNFTGICKWAKVQQPDKKFNVYTIDLFMDQKNLDLFKESGIQLTIKQDPELGAYVTFRRPVAKLINGELQEYNAPRVRLDGEEYDGLIGNGSKVKVLVSVYDSIKGKGHTMLGVDILELVPYEGRKIHEVT